jgi:hypothetical protein
MDGVLANLKRTKYTISRVKSQFYISRFCVMRFICDILERHLNIFKVIKIIEWPFPNNVIEVRAFIRIAVYYGIFIKNFAFIAALIYSLIKKGIRFAWDME